MRPSGIAHEPLLRGKVDLDAVRDARPADGPSPTDLGDRPGDRCLRRPVARSSRAARALARAAPSASATPGYGGRPRGAGAASITTRTSSASVKRVRLRGPAGPSLRAARAGRHRRALPRAVRRPRVPDRRRAPAPEFRRGLVRPRLGHRRPLPARPRAGVPVPAHVRGLRPPRGAAGRGRRRQRDRRRLGDLRAGRKQVGGTGGVAVGDRVWAETILHLGRAVGFDRLVQARASSTSSAGSKTTRSSRRWSAQSPRSSRRWRP